jgi:V8-like Glu-specific endopeptidase
MKQMAEKISPSNILPPPMLSEQVLHLKGRKATEKMPAGVADKLRDGSPEMEEIDGRRYPKGAPAVSVPALKAHEIEQSGPTGTDPFIPDHVDVEYVARLEPKSMRRPKFIDRDAFIGDALGARTIFGPDNRKVFYSTAYPWRCNGKVESPLGSGSGTMVGPRHLLTCSHIIDWRPDGTVGWLKFTPMYYNGSAPYGNAWATRVYFKYKVQGPTIDSTEAKYDYVAVVLDRTIGAATGWLGTKGYTDSWDGGAYWTHVGYPDDLTGGQRPIYQNGIALDGDFWTTDAHEPISHKADVWPGQSGGPFWGYWDGAPYAVAAQSAQTVSVNRASGGSDLVDLVRKARTDYP